MSVVKIRNALETAIDGMAGLIAAATLTSSTNGLFTSSSNHLLVSGLSVTIANHTTLNGTYLVNVVSATTFTILNKLTKAAVTGANGTGGTVKANLTAWEGVYFEPIAEIPYQEVFLRSARPENPTMGSNFYRELGYMQVSLYYPKNVGTSAISTRAELIRTTFARGNTFVKDDVVVNILKTPSIEQGPIHDSYVCSIVKIPYWSDIYVS